MLTPATNLSSSRLSSKPFEFRYAMGWFAGSFGAAPAARWHLGQLNHFTAWMVLLPESDQALVVLINAGNFLSIANANRVLSRIPSGIVDLLQGQAAPTGQTLNAFYHIFNAVVLFSIGIQLWLLPRALRDASSRGRLWTGAPIVCRC